MPVAYHNTFRVVIVPKKSMKAGGGKDLTVGIRQTLFI